MIKKYIVGILGITLFLGLASSVNHYIKKGDLEKEIKVFEEYENKDEFYIRPDYDYVDVDVKEMLKKIDSLFNKTTNIDDFTNIDKFSINDKKKLTELTKKLPITEIGKVKEVKTNTSMDETNELVITFEFNENIQNMSTYDVNFEAAYNIFLIQTLIKDAHRVHINTNLSSYMGGYDYYKEVLINDIIS